MILSENDPRHGTYNGYNNHNCRCARCRAANTKYGREYKHRTGRHIPLGEWKKIRRRNRLHGTRGAAVSHRKRGEKPCKKCRIAENLWMTEYRRKKGSRPMVSPNDDVMNESIQYLLDRKRQNDKVLSEARAVRDGKISAAKREFLETINDLERQNKWIERAIANMAAIDDPGAVHTRRGPGGARKSRSLQEKQRIGQLALELRANDLTLKEIAERLEVGDNTLYKILRDVGVSLPPLSAKKQDEIKKDITKRRLATRAQRGNGNRSPRKPRHAQYTDKEKATIADKARAMRGKNPPVMWTAIEEQLGVHQSQIRQWIAEGWAMR